jgi:hypothetical protein
METIKLLINKEKVHPDEIEIGTKGSVGMQLLEPQFSTDWDGMLIKAIFQPVRGRAIEVAFFGDPIFIPWEVNKHSGIASVVFHGYVMEDGNLRERILTEPCHLIVAHTLDDKAVNGVNVTPTMYEQLRQGIADEIANAMQYSGGVYILQPGQSLADVPEGYHVVIDPFNPDEVEYTERYIVGIYRTSGEGRPGETDTYTIYFSDNTTSRFDVTNGTAITVSDTVTQGDRNPVSGAAVYAYVNDMITKLKNGTL